MIYGIIDRFEGSYAVVEIEGLMQNIELSSIPSGAREGDVIIYDGNRWQVDKQATADRKQHIQRLADELWK